MTSGRTARRTPPPAVGAPEILTSDELGVVSAWRSYTPGSNPDAIVTGGHLMTRRGKIYYDSDSGTPDGRVCIGRTIPPGKKEAYTQHAMVPSGILLAVAMHADVIDATPRDHQ